MSKRTLKLSFRHKPGAHSPVKVYVTVRLGQERGPKQLHLACLPATDRIADSDKRRLARRLQELWREHFGSATVAIDWVASEQKWGKWGQPNKASVNRQAARQQLQMWQSGADEELLPHFGGPRTQTSELTGGEFHELFMKSHQAILKRLSHSGHSVDPAEVASWWEEREAPRLLCGYHRLAARRPALRFARAGFLRYLAGNIARGFAVAQFLREHPSPLTDSTSLGSDEAESEG